MKKFLAAMVAGLLAFGAVAAVTSCQKADDVLVVYTEAGFAPFEYEKDGKIVGVDVDIMNKVGEKLGKKVQFENVAFDTIIDAVSAGKLTKVGSAGISVTEARKQKVNFSTEYYTAALYVIYPVAQESSYVGKMNVDGSVDGVYWDNLAGKTIAVQNGTTADLFLGDEIAEGGTIYDTGAKKTGFTSLASAVADIGLNSDVLIIDELPAKELIKGKSNLACAPLYYKGGEDEQDEAAVDVYAIAVNKNETAILNAINEVIAELGKDGIQALVNKHLGL